MGILQDRNGRNVVRKRARSIFASMHAAIGIIGPAQVFADPVSEMTEAVQDCLSGRISQVGGLVTNESEILFSCISAIDLECRSSAVAPGADRYSCWNTQLEAWTTTREALFQELVAEVSKLNLPADKIDGDLVEPLVRADQSWQQDRYADCEYRALRWQGEQRIVESYTCPVEIEARRAITYSIWMQMPERMEIRE
jgi:hypothetical protein